MALRAAFIFLSPKADPKVHSSTIKTESIDFMTVGVVRFDIHPGLGDRSGDIVFNKNL